jgi:uncharacterized membrane protein
MDWKKIGFKVLDGFTRTWASFWVTWLFIFGWCIWNSLTNTHPHWDAPPYLLLMGVITILSYMQNIVIMTELKEEKARNEEMEKVQRQMFHKMFDMVEEIHEDMSDAERLKLQVQTDRKTKKYFRRNK